MSRVPQPANVCLLSLMEMLSGFGYTVLTHDPECWVLAEEPAFSIHIHSYIGIEMLPSPDSPQGFRASFSLTNKVSERPVGAAKGDRATYYLTFSDWIGKLEDIAAIKAISRY